MFHCIHNRSSLLADKQRRRRADERIRPLASYRARELAHMAENFFGADRGYHEARHRFVHKLPAVALLHDAVEERVVLSAA